MANICFKGSTIAIMITINDLRDAVRSQSPRSRRPDYPAALNCARGLARTGLSSRPADAATLTAMPSMLPFLAAAASLGGDAAAAASAPPSPSQWPVAALVDGALAAAERQSGSVCSVLQLPPSVLARYPTGTDPRACRRARRPSAPPGAVLAPTPRRAEPRARAGPARGRPRFPRGHAARAQAVLEGQVVARAESRASPTLPCRDGGGKVLMRNG